MSLKNVIVPIAIATGIGCAGIVTIEIAKAYKQIDEEEKRKKLAALENNDEDIKTNVTISDAESNVVAMKLQEEAANMADPLDVTESVRFTTVEDPTVTVPFKAPIQQV